MEQDLNIKKPLVEAQRLDSFNLYTELTQVQAELVALKAASLAHPIPTQQSQLVSKGASASTSDTSAAQTTTSMPSSSTLPIDLGFDPEGMGMGHDKQGLGQEDLPRRLGYDPEIEQRQKLLNKQIYVAERRLYVVTKRFWPLFKGVDPKMWPPIYVMKSELDDKVKQRLVENPVDEDKPGYQKVDPECWQIKEVMKNQSEWRFCVMAKYRMIKEYAVVPRHLWIDPTFFPTPRKYAWD